MNKTMRKLSFIGMLAAMLVICACKNKKPSVFKVFVRSANNELVSDAKVVIIGDVNSNPKTPEYVDTVLTNGSGYAQFDLTDFVSLLPKDQSSGYFNVVAKKGTDEGTAYVQVRAHITSVTTVNFQ